MIMIWVLGAGYLGLVATISLIAVLHGDAIRRLDARNVLDILVRPRRLKSPDLADRSSTTLMSDSSTD